MNIITVDEEVWKHLNERLKAISEYILKLEDTSYDSLWLNNHEVCQYLHISEKTLWRMRTVSLHCTTCCSIKDVALAL